MCSVLVGFKQKKSSKECYKVFWRFLWQFQLLLKDTINYIKQRFASWKEPRLCEFIVFDGKLWSDSLVGFGQKTISNLVTYYREHNYFSEKEKKKTAISEWPLFVRSVKLQVTQRNNLFEIYIDLLRKVRENMKNILAILNIMLFISGSTTAVVLDFSKLNIRKTSLRTGVNKQ